MKFMPLNIQLFGATLSISANECDISEANNTSYVNLSISVTTTGSTYNNSGEAYVNATLTGQNDTLSIPKTFFNIGTTTTKVVYSGKIGPFRHNADGKLSPVTISVTSHVSPTYNPSGSATCTMSTIPRKSSFTATNGEIEGQSIININRASGSFTHTLTYNFNGLTGTIATKTNNISVPFNIPADFYAKIPDQKKANCIITCDTYSGNTFVGSNSTTIEVSCNEAKCRPVVDATIIDINRATTDLTDSDYKLVKYYSTARVTPLVSPKNSARIVSVKVNGNPVGSYVDYPKVTTGTFTITATDSRGFSTPINKTATLIAYVPLTCNAEFKRKTQTGSIVNLKYSGNYYDGSFGDAVNNLTMSWMYREKGTTAWINGGPLTPTKSGNTYNGTIECGSVFDYQKSYEFIVYYKDKLVDVNTGVITLSKGVGALEVYEKAIKANGEVLFYWD